MATRCGFDDPESYCMRSNRRAGIQKLCNDDALGSTTIEAAARHKTCTANKLYQSENEKQHQARSKCFHKSNLVGNASAPSVSVAVTAPTPTIQELQVQQ